jgi:hypothetical protein
MNMANVNLEEVVSSMEKQSGQSRQLAQPWQEWYTPVKDFNYCPRKYAITSRGSGQGSIPQKPRNVDLSKEKTHPTNAR